MSRLVELRKFLAEAPWNLWTAQVATIMRIEVGRNLRHRRVIWLYVVAALPLLIVPMIPIAVHSNLEQTTNMLAFVFQNIYLRFVIFGGCVGLFSWLLRGEMAQKTLHYYFLAPVRRQVVLAGKFLAGLITTAIIFGLSVFLSFVLIYAQFGSEGTSYVLHGSGLGQLASYLGVTLLACLGYGAIFVTLSLFIRNPILPAVVVLFWEICHPVLPAFLQRLSVMFYLQQLCPIALPQEGGAALFTVIVEPVSPWAAVPGLILLSVVVLVIASLKIQKTEISYLAD